MEVINPPHFKWSIRLVGSRMLVSQARDTGSNPVSTTSTAQQRRDMGAVKGGSLGETPSQRGPELGNIYYLVGLACASN